MVHYYRGKHRISQLLPSLTKVGRSLGRRSRMSIVNQVLKDKKMKEIVMKKAGVMLRKELKEMCKLDSCFCAKDASALEEFQWSNIATELKAKAPILSVLFDNAITRTGLERDITVVLCSAILVKSHNERANIVQILISLLLYASHAPKQVCINVLWQ